MKSVWGLIASIIKLIVGFASIISYIIIAINGETMLKWTATLILAIGFFVIGIIGIIDWIKSRQQKRIFINETVSHFAAPFPLLSGRIKKS